MVWMASACGNGSERASNAPLPDAPPPSDAIPTGGENCFDGIDNNGNGEIDCADPACAGVAMCAPAVPAGWMGHAALYDDATMPALGCLAPWTQEIIPGHSAPTGAPATCGTCACGPSNGTACEPSGGAASKSAVTYATVGLACEGAPPSKSSSCAGSACVAAPPAAFNAGLCIHHSGAVDCAAPYSERHVFFAGESDTRGCTPCSCDAPVGTTCTPHGGAPSGAVVGIAATTFCCLASP